MVLLETEKYVFVGGGLGRWGLGGRESRRLREEEEEEEEEEEVEVEEERVDDIIIT